MNKSTFNIKIFSLSFLILLSSQLLSQTFTKIFDFEETDGSRPHGKLITDGTYFYGMTGRGGANDVGTIFKVKIDGSSFEKLHDFDEMTGFYPYYSLTLIGSELYGTTRGTSGGGGVVFKIGTDGSDYTTLKNLIMPHSTLYFDGTFLYGTTYSEGIAGGGSIYKIKPDGSDYTVVHNFNGTNRINGTQPNNDLWFDGIYFYGVTFNGGENEDGVIYKIKPDGTEFVKLHDFIDNHNNTNVSSGGVILHEGYLYGNTFLGEDDENGFIYKIKTDGSDFTILLNFTSTTGIKPAGELVMNNGYLYGTTSSSGGIFRIKPDGTDFSIMYQFNTDSGYAPRAGLIKHDNFLYGMTTSGGEHTHGTIYRFSEETLAITETKESSIKFYPNPVQNYLHVEIPPDDLGNEIIIFDSFGRKVFKNKADIIKQTIDLSALPAGIYFLQIGKEQHKIIRK